MRLVALPISARPHAKAAEHAVVSGASFDVLTSHMDAVIAETLPGGGGSAAAADPELTSSSLEFYKGLLRQARWRKSDSVTSKIVEHLNAQPALQADETIAHLASADLVWRRDLQAALALLTSLRVDGVPLSAGTFDQIMQAASKARDRRTAYAAYRQLRRCHLTPTAYTLNALMNVETRSGRPTQALELLQRARRGAPRWLGAEPDTWCYTTAMAAAKQARQYETVGRLFTKVTSDPRLRDRVGTVTYNLAIDAKWRTNDKAAARELLRRMRLGVRGAPTPQTDTFNVLIQACGDRGDSYRWVLQEMSACQVQPDSYTVSTMVKLQPTLNGARGMWRWGRRRGAAGGFIAWSHLIEAHIRHGQPSRVAALLQLMETRDGVRADTARAHNLYLRGLVASGRPEEAVAHFERMCGADPPPSTTDSTTSAGATRAAWLRRTPPEPDGFSYSIALTALRDLDGDTLGTEGSSARVGQKKRQAALELVRNAEARGTWSFSDTAPLPAAVAHSLVCACGDDLDSAIVLWRDYLRPRFVAERGDQSPPAFSPVGVQPTGEQAALHALMRVCGTVRRADEALRIAYAARKDGCELDASFYSAYMNGKQAAAAKLGKRRGSLLQSSYEKLLAAELNPDRMGGPRLPGGIERIRIQF